MNSPRITIIGGGSVQWSPKLLVDILSTVELADCTVTLCDTDEGAAERMQLYGRQAARQLGSGADIRIENHLDRALAGADYVIVTISTGGLAAMRHDLEIPEQFGIQHTVGDSTGPGGWSRLIRNFDVIRGIGKAVKRCSPNAMVLNYTNPLSTLTDVLVRESGTSVVGLCHGLYENLQYIQDLYEVEESAVVSSYGGLNHFFWMSEIFVCGVDVLDELRRAVDGGESLSSLAANSRRFTDLGGYHSRHDIATELFRLTGWLPYLADRHTSEFLPWGINAPQNMAAYALERTDIPERQRRQSSWVAEVEGGIRDGIAPSRLTATREAAAQIIIAHHGSGEFVDVGNLPNIGQVAGLPRGVVVETPVRYDNNGATAAVATELPQLFGPLIAGQAQAYQMVVDACYAGDRRLALQALRLEPSTSHLRSDRAQELGELLFDANEPFLTRWANT